MSERTTRNQRRGIYRTAENDNEHVSVSQNSQARSLRSSTENSLSQPSTSGMSQYGTRRTNLLASTLSQSIEDLDLSQSTQSQQRAASKLSEETMNSLVGDVIKFLLVAEQDKKPIARIDIIKAALPNHSKYYKIIMKKVSEMLIEVFGYHLVEKPPNKFMIINSFDTAHLQHSDSENTENTDRVKVEKILVFLSLAHIFMSPDRRSTQDNLFDFLRHLRFVQNDNYTHSLLGDIEHLLTKKFVQQGYFQLIPDNNDSSIKYFEWGIRAQKELSLRKVLEFVSKVYDGCPLNEWCEPYNYMLEMERNVQQ